MKLSFVIPAYNEELLIGQCLASIERELRRGNYDAEVIVVNNASKDRTKEIASSFPGVRVVDEMEKGLVKARRAGYNASTGDLIANIDADTMLTEGWVDKVLESFGVSDNVVAVSGPYIYYDISAWRRACVRLFYYGGYAGHLINKHILDSGAMLQGGNFVVKKSALEEIGGYNDDYDFYGEDTEIACRLHKVGDVVFTFDLPMLTSGRRLVHEGMLTTGYKYAMNHIWPIFFGKPFTAESKDIRP